MFRRNRNNAKVGARSRVGLWRPLGASASAVALLGGLGTAGLALASPAGAAVFENVPCNGDALVAAINSANNNGGGFFNLAPGCTYFLTNPIPNPEGPNGLPVITSQIILNGSHTTIKRPLMTFIGPIRIPTPLFRILDVARSGNLIFQGLTITGGASGANAGGMPAGGGGIVNHGHLTINNSRITDNNAGLGSGGGGIANGPGCNSPGPTCGPAVLTLNNSRVDDNRAAGDLAGGGGIGNSGTALLNTTEVDHNNVPSTNSDGGGGIFDFKGTGPGIVTLNSSRVHDNTTGGVGGGIFNFPSAPGSTVNLNSTSVNNNFAADGGGIFNSEIVNVSPASAALITGNNPNNCRPVGSVPFCNN